MSGATAPYDDGEKVTFKCNSGFKLVGDEELTCNKRVWSNKPPLCKRETFPYNFQIEKYSTVNKLPFEKRDNL